MFKVMKKSASLNLKIPLDILKDLRNRVSGLEKTKINAFGLFEH